MIKSRKIKLFDVVIAIVRTGYVKALFFSLSFFFFSSLKLCVSMLAPLF